MSGLYPEPLNVTSWNPAVGCTHISEGCRNCWAEKAAKLHYHGQKWGHVVLHPERLDQPLHYRDPRIIAVNFMSDSGHPEIPDDFLDKMFAVMALTPQHTYLLLTKRPERMRAYLTAGRATEDGASAQNAIGLEALDMCILERDRKPTSNLGWGLMIGDQGLIDWPLPNVWLGVSVEDQATADERIPLLLDTPAAHRWVSAEPLLDKIDLNWSHDKLVDCNGIGADMSFTLDTVNMPDGRNCPSCGGTGIIGGISWLCAGGESGPGARPCDLDWLRSLRDQCQAAGVPVFIKQMGSVWAKRVRETPKEPAPGFEWMLTEKPDTKGQETKWWAPDLRVRQLPEGLI